MQRQGDWMLTMCLRNQPVARNRKRLVERTGHSIPWLLPIACMCAPVSPALGAEEQPRITFDVIARSAYFDDAAPRTAAPGQALVPVELIMPLAVEIEEDVPETIQKQIAGGANSPLNKGSVVFSSSKNQNIYCGPVWSRAMGKAGPCLVDTDNDGQFDIARKAGAMAIDPDGMGTSNGWLLGVNFGKPLQLPTPIRYHRVPAEQAPRTRASLIWQSNYSSKHPGPVQISFGFYTPNDWQGTSLITKLITITYNGSPVSVDVEGIEISIVSVGSKGELNYRIKGKLQDVPLKFYFNNRVMNIIFLYI